MEKSNTTWVAGLLVVAILVSAMATMTIVTKSTGFATEKEGTTNATVTGTAVIVMVQDAIDFGSISVGNTLEAYADKAVMFKLQNMGNVNVNITVQSDALWTKAPATSNKYMFKCSTWDSGNCPTDSVVIWTNMTIGSSTTAITDLDWVTLDIGNIDIKITAPLDEPAGPADATVTFTASAA